MNVHRVQRLASFGQDYWKCRVCGRMWDDAPAADIPCPVAVIGVQARCNDCGVELSAVGQEAADHVADLSHSVTIRHIVIPRREGAAR